MSSLFTIGYANKKIDEFIELLKKNYIDCLVDVRSTPYSKQFPEYNITRISKTLIDSGIKYLSFKDEFGARRDENDVYSEVVTYDGRDIVVVNFKKVWTNKKFLLGVDRIINGLKKGLNICFMCSEKEAFCCHRGIMIGEYFYRYKNIDCIHLIENDKKYFQSTFVDKYEKNFYYAKEQFDKKNHDYFEYQKGFLPYLQQENKNLEYWKVFFSDYSNEKGFILFNYEVGYKKGEKDE